MEPSYYLGNDIGIVQSSVRVMLNIVKHLAKCPGKVPARDPSDTTFCQDDTFAEDFEYWTTAILLLLFL